MNKINHDHLLSTMEEKNASEMPAGNNSNKKKAGWSKADARYWLEKKRMFKNHGSAEYSCRFTKLKRREHFALGSPNKKNAAAKAAEIYSYLQANGWDATLEHYRPKASEPKPEPVRVLTVGAFIKAACRISAARPITLNAYTKAFRCIVSEIKEINRDGIHDAEKGGSLEWRNKVDGVELDSLKPADILAWKNSRLKAAAANPLEKRHAIVTVNSLIRNSKALFGRKILPFIEQELPLLRPLPFEGITFEKKPSMRYVSKMDPYAIIAQAKEAMADSDPEAFKVIILALVFGLRRSEIDNLLWRAFDFSSSTLIVETSEYHELKSENSRGVIDIDADTLALFRGYRAKNPTSVFVIESPHAPSNTRKSQSYRCDAIFTRLLDWLRVKGVEPSKPIHTLRKEIGSIITSEQGIFAASRYLRHSDIRITAEYYADKIKTVVPKAFEGLLANMTKVETGDVTGSTTNNGKSAQSMGDGLS